MRSPARCLRPGTAVMAVALLGAHHWNWAEGLVIPAVSIPYWWMTTMVWSPWGPDLPGLP
jgi:hypothetical protein